MIGDEITNNPFSSNSMNEERNDSAVFDTNVESHSNFNTDLNKNDENVISEEIFTDKDIPDYVYRENIYLRHKILQESLLTPEMIKVFDHICDFISQRKENNVFHIIDFFAVANLSNIQKNAFKKNLIKIVELLGQKNVSLIKVLRNDDQGNPQTIALLKKENYNFHLYHQFDEYLKKSYHFNDHQDVVILNSLEHIAEHLKVSLENLQKFCVFEKLNDITIPKLEDLNQENIKSNKVALVIDLEIPHLKQAIFPIGLAVNLLSYLSQQINIFYRNSTNEKINALVNKKLRDNNISLNSATKRISTPDINDANYNLFINIFYTVINQVYDKLSNYSYKKLKTIEHYLVISFIAKQLLINTKKEIHLEDEKTNPDFLRILIVSILASNIKKLGDVTIHTPMTLFDITSHELFRDNRNNKDKKLSSSFSVDSILRVIQKMNFSQDTIKDILIFKINGMNYYCHRTILIPLFFNLVEKERIEINERLRRVFTENPKLFPNRVEDFNKIVEENTSRLLLIVYDCLFKCLWSSLPSLYEGSKTEYWMDRFFFSKDEINDYLLQPKDLMFSSDQKKKMLKKLVNLITSEESNQDYKTLSDILNVSYEVFREKFSFFSSDIFIYKIINNSLYVLRKLLGNLFRVFKKNTSSRPLNHSSQLQEVQDNHKDREKKTTTLSNSEILNRIEKKFFFLNDVTKLKSMITSELDNWNLKLGESRIDNQNKVDRIIQTFIDRLDIKQFLDEDFDSVYGIILHNNPSLGNIQNQNSLKNYIFYKILLKKHAQLKKNQR